MQSKLIFTILCGLTLGSTAYAQQIPTHNQYILNRYLYNPAAAGATDGGIFLNHKRQWDNMPSAPVTTTGTFDMAIPNSRVGVGIQLYSDRAHLINNTGGGVTYAYHLPLNKNKDMVLSTGLTAGVVNQSFDFTKATVEDMNDAATLRDAAQTVAFNANLGFNFRMKALNIGVAIPQIANTNAKYTDYVSDKVRYQFERHILGTASYKFGKAEGITIEPSVMVRALTGLPMQFDLNALATWKETFFVGAGYRSANVFSRNAGLNGTLGFNVKQRIMIAYSVEGLTATQEATNFGLSHELMVAYKFGAANKEMEEGLKRLKDRVDGHDNAISATNKRVDSLQTANDGRITALENKTNDHDGKIAGNTNTIAKDGSRIEQLARDGKDLTGRVTDLENKAKTTTNNNNSNNTMISGRSDIAYKKMGSVYFNLNSSELTAESKASLNALQAALNGKRGNFMIYITGNASEEGDANSNLLLSMRRSAIVKAYMTKEGVLQPILVLANGEEVPETATQTKEKDRRENRRVDIFLSGE
jgi:type IX secretion system PorP/SprF family membrane protein